MNLCDAFDQGIPCLRETSELPPNRSHGTGLLFHSPESDLGSLEEHPSIAVKEDVTAEPV